LRGGKAMKLRAFCSPIILVVLIVICGNAYAIDSEIARNSLRGLNGINVSIENIREEIVKLGLTEDSIRTDVELKLRLSGIRVLSTEEWVKEPGNPYLYVYVHVVRGKEAVYIYNISVEMIQDVTLVRSPSVRCMGETWKTGFLGLALELRQIREAIKDPIDEFINAY
jgi:hypothetical protein